MPFSKPPKWVWFVMRKIKLGEKEDILGGDLKGINSFI
jgi:hypothetical protein